MVVFSIMLLIKCFEKVQELVSRVKETESSVVFGMQLALGIDADSFFVRLLIVNPFNPIEFIWQTAYLS